MYRIELRCIYTNCCFAVLAADAAFILLAPLKDAGGRASKTGGDFGVASSELCMLHAKN